MSLRGVLALFGISVFLLAVISLLVYARGLDQPEILLTLVIAGVVILLAALGGLVALLRGFEVLNNNEALGLPQGQQPGRDRPQPDPHLRDDLGVPGRHDAG